MVQGTLVAIPRDRSVASTHTVHRTGRSTAQQTYLIISRRAELDVVAANQRAAVALTCVSTAKSALSNASAQRGVSRRHKAADGSSSKSQASHCDSQVHSDDQGAAISCHRAPRRPPSWIRPPETGRDTLDHGRCCQCVCKQHVCAPAVEWTHLIFAPTSSPSKTRARRIRDAE